MKTIILTILTATVLFSTTIANAEVDPSTYTLPAGFLDGIEIEDTDTVDENDPVYKITGDLETDDLNLLPRPEELLSNLDLMSLRAYNKMGVYPSSSENEFTKRFILIGMSRFLRKGGQYQRLINEGVTVDNATNWVSNKITEELFHSKTNAQLIPEKLINSEDMIRVEVYDRISSLPINARFHNGILGFYQWYISN